MCVLSQRQGQRAHSQVASAAVSEKVPLPELLAVAKAAAEAGKAVSLLHPVMLQHVES